MTATWPENDKPAEFEEIVEPLAGWLCRYQSGVTDPYVGLPLGEREAAGCLQPNEALTTKSLAYHREQGRDVYDVVIGLAVQLGIEQGRRIALRERRLSVGSTCIDTLPSTLGGT